MLISQFHEVTVFFYGEFFYVFFLGEGGLQTGVTLVQELYAELSVSEHTDKCC